MQLSAFVIVAVALAVPVFSAPADSLVGWQSPMDASRDLHSNVHIDSRNQPMGSFAPPQASDKFGSAVSNAPVAGGEFLLNPTPSSSQLMAVPAAQPVPVSDARQTLVSTNINNQQMNQSFAVGNGPIMAILPAGSNMSATWDLSSNQQPTVGFAPVQVSSTLATVLAVAAVSDATTVATLATGAVANNVPAILPVGVSDSADRSLVGSSAAVAAVPVVGAGQPVVQQNHRVEIQLVDLQMNNSANSDLTQNIQVSVKVVAGAMAPAAVLAQNQTTLADGSVPPAGSSPSIIAAPETTSGVQQVFNGTYKTSLSNKITVSRYVTQDLCGQISDKAFLTVVVAPLAATDGATFQQQSYTCVINLNFPTAARSTESFWSDMMQCNSGNVNGYSFRLWYKVRQYNIDWADCQQSRPNQISVV